MDEIRLLEADDQPRSSRCVYREKFAEIEIGKSLPPRCVPAAIVARLALSSVLSGGGYDPRPSPPAILEGPLRGFVDEAGPATVTGWAQCETQPEQPVCLDILVDGKHVLQVLANRYRADLRAAGLGSGNHSFEIEFAANLAGKIEVRRTSDQTLLPLTTEALNAAA